MAYRKKAVSDAAGDFQSTRCYNNHKELKLGQGTILGASCLYPRAGFDVYVGFDHGMRVESLAPWRASSTEAVHAKFLIPDGGVPKDKADFDDMILWLASQLSAGKRVHVGCIGGHGRTGLVMAVLKCVIDDDQHSAEWVREHHCKKAIETKEQVNWLEKHYGIKPVAPSRGSWAAGSIAYGNSLIEGVKGMSYPGTKGHAVSKVGAQVDTSRVLGDGLKVNPVPNSRTLFKSY